MNKAKAWMAWTQAALALPGVARADVSVDYLFSDYEEADLPAAHAASGQSSERYSIQSHLLRVVAPVWQQKLGMTLTYETMSGASPWFVMPGPDGRPLQEIGRASCRERVCQYV